MVRRVGHRCSGRKRITLVALLLGLASMALAEDYWILQPLAEPPAGDVRLEARHLESGDRIHAPAHLLRQQDDAWIAGRFQLTRPGDYQVDLVTQGDQRRTLFTSRRFAPRRYDVALVIDTSRSMSANDPQALRAEAVRRFVMLARRSQAIRRLSLVAFDDKSRVLLPPTPPAEIGDLAPYLDDLRPRGRTNFDDAFADAYRMLSAGGGASPTVLFLSDGEPFGEYHRGHQRLAQLGCPIYTIGLSDDSDRQLLTQIADDTDGRFFPAPDASQLPTIFRDIFHLISPPVVVSRQILQVDGPTALSLSIDPSMRNPQLEWAARQGNPELQPPEVPIEQLPVGHHPLQFTGSGQVQVTLLADTTVSLTPVLLHPQADQGLPIATWVLLRGQARCEDVRLAAEAALPDGSTRVLSARELGHGLYAIDRLPTASPGTYTLRLQATGMIDGAPFQRLISVHAERRRVATATTTPALPTPALRLPEPDLPVPGALDLQNPARQSARPRVQDTFWAAEDRVVIDDLWPGTAAVRELTILVNSVGDAQPRVSLDMSATTPVSLRLSGQPALNRKTTLRLHAQADAASAGQRLTTQLRVQLNEQSWQVPIDVRVGVPTITVEQEEPKITDTPNWITARQTMRVRLEPAGTTPVQVASSLPALGLDATMLRPGDSLDLRLRLDRPLPPQLLEAELTFTGQGLAPVSVPWKLEVQERPGPVTARQTTTSMIDWRLILWCLLALAIAGLLWALFRGNRRAIFILTSAILHLLVLFLVIPRQEKQAEGPPEVTTIQLTSGVEIHEQQIAAETASFEPAESAPADSSESAPETAELPAPASDSPEELAAKPVQEQLDAQPEPAEQRPDVAREQLTPDPLQEVMESPQKRADHQPEPTRQDIPDAASAPRPTVARTDTTRALQLDTREFHDSVKAVPESAPVQPAIERELLEPESVDAPAESIEKRTQEAAASAANAPAPAEATPSSQTSRTEANQPSALTAAQAAPETPDQLPAMRPLPDQIEAPAPRQSSAIDPAPAPAPLPGKRRADETASGQLQPAAPTASSAMAPAAKTRPSPAESPTALQTPSPSQPVSTAPASADSAILSASHGPVSRPGIQVATATPAPAAPAKRRDDTTGAGAAAAPQADDSRPAAAMAKGAAPASPAAASVPSARVEHLAASTQLLRPAGGIARPALNPRRVSTPPAPAASGRRTSEQTGAPGRGQALAGNTSPSMGGTGPAHADRPGALGLPPATGSGTTGVSGTPTLKRVTGTGVGAAMPEPQAVAASAGAAPFKARAEVSPGDGTGTSPLPGTDGLAAMTSGAPATTQALPIGTPPPELRLAGGTLQAPPAIGLKPRDSRGDAGAWSRTLPLLQYSGDWDSDKTAMIHLAHQLEQRTGSALPLRSRTVDSQHPELDQAPFLFMTGHQPFQLRAEELRRLRDYLQQGGSLWINDSTDLGNDAFDAAVRHELPKVLPGAIFQRIPADHPLFTAPYDLSKGYRGYRVPPGDKYRQDYLEGIWIDGRLAVIYTRNDYGDGLEIDPHTHPLMPSLSDLSPAEMQEGSVRMGINISLYFMNDGHVPQAQLTHHMRSAADDAEDDRLAWTQNPPLPATLLHPDLHWQAPQGWDDTLSATTAYTPRGELRVDFRKEQGSITRRDKVVVGAPLGVALRASHGLVMDVHSDLTGGARLALAFHGPGGYLESAPLFIRPGANANVGFDLGAATFKSAQTDWAYEAAFGDNRQVDQWFLVLYPQQGAGTIRIDNVRLVEK